MSKSIIETERLLLRRFEKDDVHDLLNLLGDPEVMRFSLSGPYDREKCEDFLEKTQGSPIRRAKFEGFQRNIRRSLKNLSSSSSSTATP